MAKRIAVPVNEAGILDGHFGHCKFFILLDEENGEIVKEDKVVPPPHEPGLLPGWLADKGVTDIISGGMGERAIELFNARGVNAFVGAPKLSATFLAKEYLNGKLEGTANYCDH